MKALGYGKYAIASKYLLYAFLATVGGSIIGNLDRRRNTCFWLLLTGMALCTRA